MSGWCRRWATSARGVAPPSTRTNEPLATVTTDDHQGFRWAMRCALTGFYADAELDTLRDEGD
jgi:hypothetical protein